MKFNQQEQKISENAKKFIKQNKKLIIETFANPKIYKTKAHPVTFLMAGSPGAGKTEFSKNLIKQFKTKIVRIDADEIRTIIPHYNGNNSDIVQGASVIGMEKLIDYVFKNKLDAIIDGTLSNFDIAHRNIQRAINKGRNVEIFYIYQDPEIAWKFTKEREIIEGRRVPKDIFIKSFFNACKNIKKLKQEFKDKIKVSIIIKNYYNNAEEYVKNIDNIDKYVDIKHTQASLRKKLLNYNHGQKQAK